MKKTIVIIAVGACLVLLTILWRSWQGRQQTAIRDLVRDEEIVLQLTALTSQIAQSITSNELMGADTGALFAEQISLVDLSQAEPRLVPGDPTLGVTEKKWTVEENQTLTQSAVAKKGIWNPLFNQTQEFSTASFGFVSALSESDSLFKTLLKFSAKGIALDQQHVSFHGKVDVDWVNTDGGWKINRWHTRSMSATTREDLLFQNRMSDLFSPADLSLATRSIHEEKLVEFIAAGSTRLPTNDYSPYFKPESGYQHPAVSVVDINQDGWDDLFVTSLWDRCQLWVNEKGASFTEQSKSYGLDIHSCCTSAIFADLDNDGDADLILGRSLERSRLFWNEDGDFVDSPVKLPFLVTSVSVADCNNDGLLDIYLCTYGPSGTAAKSNPQWIEKFVPEESQVKLRTAIRKSHRYFGQAGPRNYLLINRGERRFETAPNDSAIDQFHNTYQASWADYDQDGDADVYICNDFAPDALLRNDGLSDNGIPQFTDVSVEQSSDTMKGFGMGASWGDYDNDQQSDLFVTNMYSKAGKRVLSQFGDVDDRLHFSARGNLLFKQTNGEFKQLAGESDGFDVHQGGWAFGGQFIDVDNDTWLDLYVPNGFYTAPKSVASDVDL